MPSGSSPVKETLESYVAGRVKAERLVIAVSAAYYRESENGTREALQPLMDVIYRASPGIVELITVQGWSGLDVRLARAAEAVMSREDVRAENGREARREAGEGETAQQGIVARLVAAVRGLFSP